LLEISLILLCASHISLLEVIGEINSVAIHKRNALMLKLLLTVSGVSVIVKAFDPADIFCEIITGLKKQDLVHMMESAESEQEIERLTEHANTHIGDTVKIIGKVLKETYTNAQGSEFSSYVFRASNRHIIKILSTSDDESEEREMPVSSAAASAAASSSSSAASVPSAAASAAASSSSSAASAGIAN